MKEALFLVIGCEKMTSKKGAARWAFLFLPLFLLAFSAASVGETRNLLEKTYLKGRQGKNTKSKDYSIIISRTRLIGRPFAIQQPPAIVISITPDNMNGPL